MPIDITCPTNNLAIQEYHGENGDELRKIVAEHMKEHHPDWSQYGGKNGLDFMPKDAPNCPICHSPCMNLDSVKKHVARTHTDYEKVGKFEWVLKRSESFTTRS